MEEAFLILRGRPEEQVLHLPVDLVHVDYLIQLHQFFLREMLKGIKLLIDHPKRVDTARPNDQHLFIIGHNSFEFVLFAPCIQQIRTHLLILTPLMQPEHKLEGISIGHEESIAVGEAVKGFVLVVLAPDYGLLGEHWREREGGVEVDVAAVAYLAVGLGFGVVSNAAFGDCDVQAVAVYTDVYVWEDDAFLPVDEVSIDEIVESGIFE